MKQRAVSRQGVLGGGQFMSVWFLSFTVSLRMEMVQLKSGSAFYAESNICRHPGGQEVKVTTMDCNVHHSLTLFPVISSL